jgi:hypothetical protein
MIVLTSDHGDYLGDHWLGEKDLFHEAVGEDPADRLRPATRGRRHARHDLRRPGRERSTLRRPSSRPPAAKGAGPHHRGPLASALAARRNAGTGATACDQRIRLFGDAAMREARPVSPRDARLFMVFDGRYKLIHAEGGFRPMLFDLRDRPGRVSRPRAERAAGQAEVIDRLYGNLASLGAAQCPSA